MSYYKQKYAKFDAENFPLFYSYNHSESFFRTFNYYDFQGYKSAAFAEQLYKLLPKLDFKDLKAIAKYLQLSMDNEELIDKIVKYMLSHPDFAFGNNQLRQFLTEYHCFFDELLIDKPFLDMTKPSEEQEQEQEQECEDKNRQNK